METNIQLELNVRAIKIEIRKVFEINNMRLEARFCYTQTTECII